MEPTDQELMEAVQRDAPGAFESFVGRFQRRFYRIAIRYLREHEAALDAVQDAFLKIHLARSTWEPRAQPYTWAYRIVANHCIDLLRKHGKAPSQSIDDEEGPLHGTLADPAAVNPESAVGDLEVGQALRRALDRLSAPQREILILRHYEDMSLEEIAAYKRCPLGTVKSSLHRATRSLREVLAATEGGFHDAL